MFCDYHRQAAGDMISWKRLLMIMLLHGKLRTKWESLLPGKPADTSKLCADEH